MAETAAAELRNSHPEGGDKRSKRKGDLIPHATRGMLIGRRLRQGVEAHPLARSNHGLRPQRNLLAVHSVEEDRHRERTHLLLGNHTARVRIDRPGDLLGRELALVSLGVDDINRIKCFSHGVSFRLCQLRKRAYASGAAASRSSGPND